MSESQILDLLFRYFSAYGYYIVFLLLLLENLFIIGLVVPGETVLLIAAFAAAQDMLNIINVVVTAATAAIIGNTAGYFIGRKGGRPLIERYGGRFVSAERVEAAERYFDIHGPKTVFIGRFVAGVRVFVPLLAGAARMNFAKFILYTIVAVVLWTVSISVIGYFFGQNWALISKLLGRSGLVALAAVVVILIIYYIIRRNRETLFD
ncbi:MAG: DedA family protein [Actinobacteria bacterium]|nr:DedA family protein [Actinomycetota bacterium]